MTVRVGLWARFFGTSMLLVSVLVLTAGLWLDGELRSLLETRIESELAREARVVREGLALVGPRSADGVDALCDRLGAQLDARVTIVDADGLVLGDSDVALDRLSSLENHGARPEVVAARTGPSDAWGTARRHSVTVGVDLLYVAVPWSRPDGRVGAVRVALPLDDVDAALWGLRRAILIGLAIAVAVAAVVSGMASSWVTRDLRRLLARVQGLARVEPGAEHPSEVDGLAGAFDALSSRLEGAVRALAAERDRTATVLESMEEGVILLDPDGRIALVNAAVRRLELPELPIGRTLIEAWRVVAPAELAGRALRGQPGLIEITVGASLRPRTLLITGHPTRGGGAILVLHDVTRVRHLETVRQDFVVNLSHELRTPASALSASAEALTAGAAWDPVAAAPFVEAIQRNAARLGKLVSDLLALSRIDGGATLLRPEAIEVRTAVDESMALVRVIAERRGQHLAARVQGEPVAHADRGALEQILVNLLDNALKYTQEGGRIEVFVSSEGDRVRIEIRDDGPGVPPEHRSRLFERFYRVDAGRSRFLGGTGLGLAIVRRLVEAMDGEVSMAPVEPHGSAFVVLLPVARMP